MCSCTRSIAGLCRFGSGECKAKQVKKEVRTGWQDLTLCMHGPLSDHVRRIAYPGHPQDGFKEVMPKKAHQLLIDFLQLVLSLQLFDNKHSGRQ